ncbi:hypothetical protein BJY01DRAFT_255302 [Aspergillus pseudoustus]|uniref:Uncharacterized protein n=1 Tax=Aspergillus pseudoustus TaxID=1810923 RepID=A0ABR4ILI9_9EURO
MSLSPRIPRLCLQAFPTGVSFHTIRPSARIFSPLSPKLWNRCRSDSPSPEKNRLRVLWKLEYVPRLTEQGVSIHAADVQHPNIAVAGQGRAVGIYDAILSRSIYTVDRAEQAKLDTTAIISVGTAASDALETKPIPELQALLTRADSIRHLLTSDTPVQYNPQTLGAMQSIGSLYQSQSRFKEAESMYLHALACSEKINGHGHRTTKDIIKTLRHIRFQQSRIGRLMGRYWWALQLVTANELLLASVVFVFTLLPWFFIGWVLVWLVGAYYIRFRFWLADKEAAAKGELDLEAGEVGDEGLWKLGYWWLKVLVWPFSWMSR